MYFRDSVWVYYFFFFSRSSPKYIHLCLWNWRSFCTPGLNFINVLRTAFMPVAPKIVRIQSRCQYLFTLLGSTGAKAARRTLMKLSPGADYINCLSAAFFSSTSQNTKRHWWRHCLFLLFWGLSTWKLLNTCWWNRSLLRPLSLLSLRFFRPATYSDRQFYKIKFGFKNAYCKGRFTLVV